MKQVKDVVLETKIGKGQFVDVY